MEEARKASWNSMACMYVNKLSCDKKIADLPCWAARGHGDLPGHPDLSPLLVRTIALQHKLCSISISD